MKLSDLLPNNPDELEKLSDDELKRRFAPYFTVTRPDESKRKVTEKLGAKAKTTNKNKYSKLAQLEEKMKLLGL